VKEKITRLIQHKESNLVLSADFTREEELLQAADQMGSSIAILKTHIDILENFNPETTLKLQALAKKHNFLLFEDRKFADIGSTVEKQYTGGIYKISSWADMINAHPLPGEGLIQSLKNQSTRQGCLLIAEMSSQSNLISADYTLKTLALARKFAPFVTGFICQKRLDPQFLHLTPGVSLSSKGDALGQKYRTPEEAIIRDGCDMIIVGRGIISHSNPLVEIERYRKESFHFFLANSV
jgi:uridine monophosphate synthetase